MSQLSRTLILLCLGVGCSAGTPVSADSFEVVADTRRVADRETPSETAARLGLTTLRYRAWSRWWAPGVWSDVLVQLPDGPGPHPVALYTAGTFGVVNNVAALAALDELASRGFVAAAVDYANGLQFGCDNYHSKADFLYADDRPDSALNAVCALPESDCTLGVVTMGHSQGAAMAALAADYGVEVRASAGTAMGTRVIGLFDFAECSLPELRGGTRVLPDDALLAMTGESDSLLGWGTDPEQMVRDQLVRVSGLDDATCAEDRCFRPDGSGWIRVPDAEVDDGEAQHSFMSVGTEQPVAPAYADLDAGIDPVRAHLQAAWLDDGVGIDWSLPDAVDFLEARVDASP